MSRKLINVGVRLRPGKLDRRAELRSFQKRGRALYVGFSLFSWIVVCLLIWLTMDSEGFRPTLLLFVASLSTVVSVTGFSLLSSRINTLVELLREEGVLANALAVPGETGRAQDSPGETKEKTE